MTTPDTNGTPAPAAPATDAPRQDSVGSIVRKLGPASALAIGALAFPPIGGMLILVYIDTIARWFETHGAAGVWLYAAGFALFAGLALLPTYAQSILGGWAFGVAGGFPAALGGFVGGAIIGYGVARPTASARVTALINEKPKWAAVRDALVGGSPLKTLGIVTLMRLPPNSPFAMTNLVLASTRVPLWIYIVGTAVGMAPRTFAAVWLGATLHTQFTSLREGLDAQKPWWWLAVGIALTFVVLGVIGFIANRALERVTGSRAAAAPSK